MSRTTTYGADECKAPHRGEHKTPHANEHMLPEPDKGEALGVSETKSNMPHDEYKSQHHSTIRQERSNYQQFAKDVLATNWAIGKVVAGTRESIDYLLTQICNPRENRPNPAKPRIDIKLNPLTGEVTPIPAEQQKPARPKRTINPNIYPTHRNAHIDENVTMKKNSVSWLGPDGSAPIWPNTKNDVIFIWDANKCTIDDKYVFPENARTNRAWWLGSRVSFHEAKIHKAIGKEAIRSRHAAQYLHQQFIQKAQEIFSQYEANNPSSRFHGALHATRVALYIPVLVALYADNGNEDACKLTAEDITLLQITALMHDVGRQDEGKDLWDEDSYIACLNYLQSNGVPKKTAEEFAAAIKNKDKPHKAKTLLEKILHDADCLDIMRIKSRFDISQLDCYQECKTSNQPKIMKLCLKIAEILRSHGDLTTYQINSGSIKLHEVISCQQAKLKNTYKNTPNLINKLLSESQNLREYDTPICYIPTPTINATPWDETLAKQTKKALCAIAASENTPASRLRAKLVQQYTFMRSGINLPLAIKDKLRQQPMCEYTIFQQMEDIANYRETHSEPIALGDYKFDYNGFTQEVSDRINEADGRGVKPCHVGHYFENKESYCSIAAQHPDKLLIINAAQRFTRAYKDESLEALKTILNDKTLSQADRQGIFLATLTLHPRANKALLTELRTIAAKLNMSRVIQQIDFPNSQGWLADDNAYATAIPVKRKIAKKAYVTSHFKSAIQQLCRACTKRSEHTAPNPVEAELLDQLIAIKHTPDPTGRDAKYFEALLQYSHQHIRHNQSFHHLADRKNPQGKTLFQHIKDELSSAGKLDWVNPELLNSIQPSEAPTPPNNTCAIL